MASKNCLSPWVKMSREASTRSTSFSRARIFQRNPVAGVGAVVDDLVQRNWKSQGQVCLVVPLKLDARSRPTRCCLEIRKPGSLRARMLAAPSGRDLPNLFRWDCPLEKGAFVDRKS